MILDILKKQLIPSSTKRGKTVRNIQPTNCLSLPSVRNVKSFTLQGHRQTFWVYKNRQCWVLYLIVNESKHLILPGSEHEYDLLFDDSLHVSMKLTLHAYSVAFAAIDLF